MRKLIALVRAGYAFLRLVQDPHRTDEVFEALKELQDPDLAQPLIDHVRSLPEGPRFMSERRRMGRVDLAALAKLPEGTLGRVYADHMLRLGLSPDFYPDKAETTEFDYPFIHFYETHDVWHVLTGLGTDVAGELGLQAFYVAQIPPAVGSPLLVAAGLLNVVLYARSDGYARFAAISRGFAMGRAAAPLFGVMWTEHWETPLAELRARFRIEVESGLAVRAG